VLEALFNLTVLHYAIFIAVGSSRKHMQSFNWSYLQRLQQAMAAKGKVNTYCQKLYTYGGHAFTLW